MVADARRIRYVRQHMRIHKARSNSHVCGEQVASEDSTQPQFQQIKLAMSLHAASVVWPALPSSKAVLLNPQAHVRARKPANSCLD